VGLAGRGPWTRRRSQRERSRRGGMPRFTRDFGASVVSRGFETKPTSVGSLNALIPRVDLGARTPDEAYAQANSDLAVRLATAHTDARRARIEANRAVHCATCVPIPDHLSTAP